MVGARMPADEIVASKVAREMKRFLSNLSPESDSISFDVVDIWRTRNMVLTDRSWVRTCRSMSPRSLHFLWMMRPR